ncbi:response regulator transcription factor [Buchananella hordeovulneris]|uniref:response regulator transcription factor n=1 Tax=Buchananella hordeovulneris TaxID=52770 RepID=UPI000A006688|nr:response regulator transcription factor [Buchananella hordeovulneris]MDO5079858.1 response regulator transcription factor [Buchananella hordeovulneris]RRD43016.1 DNA-binding response regulator [Buchananella hordeovulneris]RRD52283.1 DNA-binding response regulator [Buchananella hordeovulneris]
MKVLVVDDNVIVRAGLRTVLSRLQDPVEIFEAGDGQEAIEVAQANNVDVVLLDVQMPRMNGLDALPTLALTSAVIMLTNRDDTETIRRSLTSGARGYLVHGQLGADEIAGALATCRAGGMVLGREAANAVQAGPVSTPRRLNPLRARLTEREADVLEAAASGMSNDEIAQAQFLSPRTVKNYLNSAYPKLGVHNRVEAILAWLDAEPS